MRAYVAHLKVNRITEMDGVQRFTPHYFYLDHGRMARTDSHQHYAPSWGEARTALVGAARERITLATQDLANAQRDLAAAEAMLPPDAASAK